MYAQSSGELEDDANLGFDGTSFVVGSAVTITAGDGGIFVRSGIVTAGIVTGATYYGDGSNLVNLPGVSLGMVIALSG